jgi:hypothetical protein
VPGTAALNTDVNAQISWMSCAPAGNCGAGGYYTGRSDFTQAFVVSEVKGKWGKAQEVPGMAALHSGDAAISSVSCASAGNCGAGGYYTEGSVEQALVVGEVKGKWGKVEEVPGTAAFSGAEVASVSCASAGNCGAGGWYLGASGYQAFVVSEVKGKWGKAQEVPGTASLNTDRDGEITSVSCASAGNCGAGGYYRTVPSDGQQAFVVSEVKR